MIAYGHAAVRHFPKMERHVLGAEIRATMWAVLRLIVVCNKRYHKKTTLQDLGYRIWTTHRKLRKSSISRICKKLRSFQRKYAAGKVTMQKVRQSIKSWVAHASHANTYRLRKKLLWSFAFTKSATNERNSDA